MQKKNKLIVMLAAAALSISTIATFNVLKVQANSEKPAETVEQKINDETLILEAQQMAEAFKIQMSQPRLVEYVAKATDTPETIASTYELKLTTITVSNALNKDSKLQEGQKLFFPSVDGIAYKIKDGENLWDLAMLYKIDFNDLLVINNLSSPNKLKLGQQIILPGIEALKEGSQPKKDAAKAASTTSLSRGVSTTRGVWPARGAITSRYGKRWGRQHQGIDIGVPSGTSVKAFASGKVVFSGWEGGYGYLVRINHGNGLETYYAHNSKLLVKVGQTVEAGSVIAKSGNTGNSTGPHVHFEVRKNGAAVNPFSYLN
jgi:murein DD-endopeptidase MepM/ murein hydrolase activator NlpD